MGNKEQTSVEKLIAFGIGLRRRNKNKTLDVWFPAPSLKVDSELAERLEELSELNKKNGFFVIDRKTLRQVFNEECSLED